MYQYRIARMLECIDGVLNGGVVDALLTLRGCEDTLLDPRCNSGILAEELVLWRMAEQRY